MSREAFLRLETLQPGERVIFGDKVVIVSQELAQAFRPGDSLLAIPEADELLHVPSPLGVIARQAVERAAKAFEIVRATPAEAVLRFYDKFVSYLEDDTVWTVIKRANEHDVERAQQRGRSVTRLRADETLRASMIDGLKNWCNVPSKVGEVLEVVEHPTWKVELLGAPLGVVGFVFEGRPNVLVDSTGVLRNGNVAVLRIGGDALSTAHAIAENALWPALIDVGLPKDAIVLLDSAEHAAAWALCMETRISLIVIRGSGRSVRVLGGIARQSGVPASLHGTGGAWLFIAPDASQDRITDVVASSLDRKVCNTMNTCVIYGEEPQSRVHAVLAGLERAAAKRGTSYRLHVTPGTEHLLPPELFTNQVTVIRPEGSCREIQVTKLNIADLGEEWEWEETPEASIVVVDSLTSGVTLFNRFSPQFVASLLSTDNQDAQLFYETVNAPFVGDGFTRWVDGQYALKTPELGLANWETGRLFGRAGVLSGTSIYTVRTRVTGMSTHTPSR
jgi:glutamate-5-semialdehyde dehydrogenase